MEKKRSIVVIIFGVFYILFALVNLLSLCHIYGYNSSMGMYKLISIILLSTPALIIGINLLWLREWARKSIVYFNIFAGVYLAFSFFISALILVPGEKLMGVLTSRLFLKSVLMLVSVTILIVSISIYFFTRPKVKELFR